MKFTTKKITCGKNPHTIQFLKKSRKPGKMKKLHQQIKNLKFETYNKTKTSDTYY